MASLLAFALLIGQDAPPSWSADVRPILAEHCFACHGPDESTRSASLRLDTDAGLRGTGEGPAALDAVDLLESELLYRVMAEDGFERMPPPGAGEPLTQEEVGVLRRWLEAGAPWEPHWAYRDYADLDPPAGADPRARGPIDHFVAARLAAAGHRLAAEAEPRELVRRLHLDLTGLVPAPEVVEAFMADPSDRAYASLVDELLGSVAHAEHWARHWLDIARYADSHGYTIDGGRSIWPWRDWVVRSVHADQPFDDFTVEQLAGDLLPEATREQRIATGFHRNTQINQEGGAKDEENRVNAVIDRVATTGTIWLGTSVACAQCHTHKFDPVTQTEYFGLFAYFNSTTDGGVLDSPRMMVPRSAAEEEAVEAFEVGERVLESSHRQAWDASAAGWAVWQPERATGSNGPELRPQQDGSYRLLGQNPVYSTYVLEGVPPEGGAGGLRLEVLPEFGPGRGRKRVFRLQELRVLVEAEADGAVGWEPVMLVDPRVSRHGDDALQGAELSAPQVADGNPETAWSLPEEWREPEVLEVGFAAVVEAGRRLRLELVQESGGSRALGHFRALLSAAEAPPAERALVSARWRAAWAALALHRRKRPGVPTTLVLEERARPRETRRFRRGSFLDPMEPVQPHVPAALDRSAGDPPADRLAFARWLVAPENALQRRVTVNRWWSQLFGRGFVDTEDDFGLRGARPSHPDLLEWLARQMLEDGDSRRAFLRRAVLSATYRQSREAPAALVQMDPDNRLLGRRGPARLSGEVIRDSMLRASGKLVERPFGPPVEPPQPEGVFTFTQARKSWTPPEGEDRWRRSLYTRIWRSSPFPFFGTFDAPARDSSCARRRTSRTPLQALTLANDPQVMELAHALADRLDVEVGRDGVAADAARIDAAYRWCFQRSPADEEQERIAGFVAAVRERDGARAAWIGVARALFNTAEFTHRP